MPCGAARGSRRWTVWAGGAVSAGAENITIREIPKLKICFLVFSLYTKYRSIHINVKLSADCVRLYIQKA